ncbi:MAG: hypothetical protein OES12_10490 [Anaerolineae bacterium]|nr:hypothetical protein [Anaerolineae bacterium]
MALERYYAVNHYLQLFYHLNKKWFLYRDTLDDVQTDRLYDLTIAMHDLLKEMEVVFAEAEKSAAKDSAAALGTTSTDSSTTVSP